MSTLDHSAMPLPAAIRPAIWARLAGRTVAFTRFWKNRSAFTRLMTMTDGELRDIGLRRHDVLAANSAGFSDPIARLTAIVDDRQSGEAAARRVS